MTCAVAVAWLNHSCCPAQPQYPSLPAPPQQPCRASHITLLTRPVAVFFLSFSPIPLFSFSLITHAHSYRYTYIIMSYGNDSYGDQQYRGNYGASGPDFSDLANHAESHHGSSSSYFNEAQSHLQQNHGEFSNQDIDEGHAVESHRKLYGGGGPPADSNELGAGAAMEALKKFSGGGGGSSSGGGQNQLIGLAMSEAEKLFDQHGGSVSFFLSFFSFLFRFFWVESMKLICVVCDCIVRRQAVCCQLRRRNGIQDVRQGPGQWSRRNRWSIWAFGSGQQVLLSMSLSRGYKYAVPWFWIRHGSSHLCRAIYS